MKILTLDLELAPNIATVWSLWGVNVGLNQLLETSRVLCFAAKWYGDKKVMFHSEWTDGPEAMLVAAKQLLEEADVVVGYNTQRYDVPVLNREFVKCGISPPSPVQHVDLLKVVKKNFRFVSNKLAHINKELGLPQKEDAGGHETWLAVMNGDKKAQKRMARYNKQDVIATEALYDKLLPWISNHPNHALFKSADAPICPNCGGHHVQRRGYQRTKTARYRRYVCTDCGTWSRERVTDLSKEEKQSVLTQC